MYFDLYKGSLCFGDKAQKKEAFFMDKVLNQIQRYIILILLFVTWYVWGVIYQPVLAPTPLDSIYRLIELVTSGAIPRALSISLGRIFMGLAISISISLIIGVLMAQFRNVERNFDPIIQSIRHIAPISFVPLAILWFGTGTPSAVFVIAFASFFPMLLNVISGVKAIDPVLIKASKTMGINKFNLMFRVILPATFPSILNGMRVSTGIAWTSVIAAELAVSADPESMGSGGIGQMMFSFYAYSVDTNSLIACMVGLAVISLILDLIFRWLQKKWANWAIQE